MSKEEGPLIEEIHDKDETEKKEEEDDEVDSDDEAGDKGGEEGGKKLTRSEKKCKKAFLKIGMKPLSGITRVTLKRRDKIVFYVDTPEILKSGTSENSYVILGELKMLDQGAGPGGVNFKPGEGEGAHAGHDHPHPHPHPHPHSHDEKPAEKSSEPEQAKEKDVVVKGDDEVDLEGLNPDDIEMVMQHASCTKAQAARALREANGDLVTAVMKVSQWDY